MRFPALFGAGGRVVRRCLLAEEYIIFCKLTPFTQPRCSCLPTLYLLGRSLEDAVYHPHEAASVRFGLHGAHAGCGVAANSTLEVTLQPLAHRPGLRRWAHTLVRFCAPSGVRGWFVRAARRKHLFYSILFYSILFYSIPFYSILFQRHLQ